MNLRPRRREAPDINLTPLIDIVFLLLIFFMVSTTFSQDARLRLELPRADGVPAQAGERDMLELVVDAAGRFYVDSQAVSGTDTAAVRRALGAAAGPDSNRSEQAEHLPVLIRADAKTPHQAVMTALDALGQLGMHRVAFATQRTDEAR